MYGDREILLQRPKANWPTSQLSLSYLTLPEVDREVDELAVFPDQVFQSVLCKEILGLLLHEERDGGSSQKGVAPGVPGYGEGGGI